MKIKKTNASNTLMMSQTETIFFTIVLLVGFECPTKESANSSVNTGLDAMPVLG